MSLVIESFTEFEEKITSAFEKVGYDVEFSENDTAVICNSGKISSVFAYRVISEAGYRPIISQNRINDDIEFTVEPNKTPDRFNKRECEKREMSQAEFWEKIEMKRGFNPNAPVEIQGKVLGTGFQVQEQIFLESGKVSTYVIEYMDTVAIPGRGLDLGCGTGANTLPLLDRGWSIIGIDNCVKGLQMLGKVASERGKNHLLTLMEADITSQEYPPGKFDLIVCINVLPYIQPTKLRALMVKIHSSLRPNGRFIGTFFFSNSSTDLAKAESLEKFGMHLYEGEYMGPALLKHTGFQVEDESLKDFGEGLKICYEFVAKV